MATGKTIHHQLRRVVFLLGICAFLIAIALSYRPTLEMNRRMQSRLMELNEEIKQVEQEKRILEATLRSLTQDPRAIERLARERLGYSRPGETVVKFTTPSSNSASVPERVEP